MCNAVGINHGAARPGAVLTVTAGAGEGGAGHSKYTKYLPSLDAACGTRLCVETLIYFISSQY